MADTTLTQATLTQIEAAITQALLSPKETIKGRIDLDEGGSLEYRSFDELINARNNIKKILDNDSDIDFASSKKSAYRPFTQTVQHEGNL